MEMAGEPDCCQTPVQNVAENISEHPSMLLQLCLQESSSSEEVLKEQKCVPLLICIYLKAQISIIVLVNRNLTQ